MQYSITQYILKVELIRDKHYFQYTKDSESIYNTIAKFSLIFIDKYKGNIQKLFNDFKDEKLIWL